AHRGRRPGAHRSTGRRRTGAHPMSTTTTAATTTAASRTAGAPAGWASPSRRVGRIGPPVLVASFITVPAVAAAASGRLSIPSLAVVFLVALSATLLAATLGLRLIHFVDGSAGAPATSRVEH